jgi:tRNA threonylcarbamoyladenosine biosynthesis protein TsaE
MTTSDAILVRSLDPSETEALAATVGGVLEPGTVLHLLGGLGAGKTTFVRGLARGLGLDAEGVSSPTFVRLARHDRHDQHEKDPRSLVHVDGYRVEDEREAASLEIEAVAEECDAIVAIEWPDRLGTHAPPADLVVSIDPDESALDAGDADLPRGARCIAILDRRPDAARRRLAEAMATVHAGRVRMPPASGEAHCAICGKTLSGPGREQSFSPFCSPRCRGADLGRWFSGDYAISRPLDPEQDADVEL